MESYLRQPKTAKDFFFEEKKREVRNRDPSRRAPEVKKVLEQMWNALEDKTRYFDLEDQDRARTIEAKEEFLGPKPPKRPHLLFTEEVKPQLRRENPTLKPIEINRMANHMWKNASEEVKQRYLDLYCQRLNLYNNRDIGVRVQQDRVQQDRVQGDRVPNQPDFWTDRRNQLTHFAQVLREAVDELSAPVLVNQRARMAKRPVPPHMTGVLLKSPPEERECAICKETVDCDMYLTPCYHLFHLACVERCDKCPMCREKI